MRDLRGTYVHRGDRLRRRQKFKRSLAGVACCTALLVVYENQRMEEARAAWATHDVAAAADLSPRLATRSDLAAANAQLERWNRIFSLCNRYSVGSDLAGAIHDIATDEGIEPDLAFRLVRLESDFKQHATSPVGAIGLTQVMPSTARYFQKGITREQLYDRDTNLRIGFRYLRGLIREYHGDVGLALLAYNRGPAAVERSRREGRDPSNGYERKILRGYKGDGVVEQ